MTDIFISYSRADRERVAKLAAGLEASGFAIWWDKVIAGGTDYSLETETRLNQAAFVIVCWSKASIESMWVADEATVGRDKGNLVPIAIDAVAPKIGFRQIQTIDFSAWSGETSAPEFLHLTQSLRAKLMGKSATRPQSDAAALAPRQRPIDHAGGGLAARRNFAKALFGMVALFAAIAIVVTMSTRRSRDLLGDKSIVVLPFENRSQSKDDSEYGDWLAELISGLLGKTGDLKVISQTSAAAFKGKAVALPEIARQLGVALVIEGSVRSEGNDIVISAQLIDAASDTQVWAETYERKSANALGVQSEVAAKVAAAVAAKLQVLIGRGEQQALTPAVRPESNEAYQKAGKLYGTLSEANIRSAQRLLNEAVERDPNFALAWALLSRVHSFFYFNRTDATEGRSSAAEQALANAMRLNPDLAEVRFADAYFQYWVKRDYEGARVRFEELSAVWPNNAPVLTALASITRRQGRWGESKTYFERTIAIDPLGSSVRLKAAEMYFATRDFEGALRQLDAALARWPQAPDSLPFLAKKALVYQALGRLDEADALLDGMDPQPDGEQVQPIVYQAILRRRYDGTIRLLEKLVQRDEAEGSVGRASIDLNLYLGDLRRYAGDTKGAAVSYRAALDELRLELAKQPQSADIQSYLALAFCGLGDRAEARRYAVLAVENVPVAKDALSGAYYLDVHARVSARLADRNAAILAIENLVKAPAPLPLTAFLLRTDPDFDMLRSDPRFKAILTSAR